MKYLCEIKQTIMPYEAGNSNCNTLGNMLFAVKFRKGYFCYMSVTVLFCIWKKLLLEILPCAIAVTCYIISNFSPIYHPGAYWF